MPGHVSVPQPKKDLDIGLVQALFKAAGLNPQDAGASMRLRAHGESRSGLLARASLCRALRQFDSASDLRA